ncbi:MAG: glycosyltransferase [Melioribacteraceae bacterium]|nr:glycosyltransferase [Melioribacteraceae bacterium]
MDEQQKPDVPTNPVQQTIPVQPGATSGKQEPQNKRPGRKYYYNRKKFKPAPGQQEFSPREKTKLTFKKISIVVPLFNEEESLRPFYAELKKAIKSFTCDCEIVFVDDGSTDKSLAIIKEFARTDNKIKYLSFRANYGKSAALQMGFRHASGDAIITMDADLQDDPSEIINLLRKLEEGFDLVSGWKKKRYDPFIKKISSKFFNFVTRVLTRIKIHDFNCGLKAYRKDVVQAINVYGELHRYIPVLAKWKGFTISEVVVNHHPRRYGKTKFGISRFFKGFIDLITVIFTTRYITRPMHLFGFFGLIAAFAGFLISLYLTYEKFILGTGINNRPIFFLGILLIIVGIQFFAIGLIGELIVHSNQDEKEYVIKEKK